jgi:hypothetical protein
MKNLALATVTALILVLSSSLQAAIIADSEADWTTYRNDGIDENGSSVTPGSKDDAVQQGHADSSGTGSWEYGYYDVSDSNSFSQLPFWENGDTAPGHLGQGFWGLNEVGGVQSHQLRINDATRQHPSFTNSFPDDDAVRRWTSGVAGTVTVSGEVQRPSGEGSGRDGIIAMFFLDGTELTDERIEIVSAYDHDVRTYEFDVSVGIGSTLDFVVDDRNNTSGDLTVFTATIIPEPASLALVLLGTLVFLRRRRW